MVYNNEDFIERTLLSIVKNDTKYFDIIINDDCSTDNSVSVVKGFLREHKERTSQWQFNLNKVNIGINASIKNILETNKNVWVKYLAGDDEFEPGSLSEYYQLAIMTNPESSIVLSDMNLINKHSEFIGERKSLSPFFYEHIWLKTANLYINTINAPTVMIGRKSLLSALDKTKARNAEDWPVLRYCILKDFDFKVCEKPLIKYRLQQDSLSSSYNSTTKQRRNVNKISDQVEILLNENRVLSDLLSVKKGIYIQLKLLKTENQLKRLALKTLKLINIQFCIFRLLAFWDGARR